MIEVIDLWKSYGPFTALRGISFVVPRGRIVGFLGPNGAGKSTTIRILTTFLPVGKGTVRVAGHDVWRERRAVCESIGYMPEQVAFYPEMRVREYLSHRAVLCSLPRARIRARVDAVMEMCGLTAVARKLLAAVSRGYRQRTALADALLKDPPVLILDEPTAGLDPLQVIEVRKLIDGMRGERTVLLSSHILGEVEQVCDEVIIIHEGSIRAHESREGWHRRVQTSGLVRVAFERAPTDAAARLREIDGVVDVRAADGAFLLRTDREVRAAVFRLAAARGWTLVELREMEATLESLFIEVTARSRESA